ncbi:MAG TPA: hypothetical protein VI033_08310 [Candidatus Nitrosopolaris sp.]
MSECKICGSVGKAAEQITFSNKIRKSMSRRFLRELTEHNQSV